MQLTSGSPLVRHAGMFLVGTHLSVRRCVEVLTLIAPFCDAVWRMRRNEPAKAIVMRVELSQARSPGGLGPVSSLLTLLLFATLTVSGSGAFASDVGVDPRPEQQQLSHDNGRPEENHGTKQNTEPAAALTAPSLCDALGAAATANELPVNFFARLIWQESRFKPDAISRKGAQGIAQFMPATARASGLENPFNPLDAITKSGQLLGDLRREFGNLGLAAAAYNAGSGRVHDWLGKRRQLPQETRAYVRIVTGRSVEEWAGGTQINLVEMPSVEVLPCDSPVTALVPPHAEASQPKSDTIKPWGVEIVGGTTPESALARYQEWQPKFAAIVAGRESHVVIRGVIGHAGAARVRVGEDTRAAAEKLCAALRAAGTYCDVLRN
ncbi:MAG TPA: lytic transglycosylase domain-containing protein [Bradyrhizobium sp.]|nr:lytic transglycosylase domain-containing protein [Bradyrhizobium sp.]